MRKIKHNNAILTNIELKTAIEEYLLAIVSDLFRWEGLPEGANAQQIEKWLFKRGHVGFIQSTTGYYILPCTFQNLNVYLQPVEIDVISPNGIPLVQTSKDPLICWDNPTHCLLWPHMTIYIEKMTEIMKTIDIRITQARLPFIFKAKEEQKDTINRILTDVEQGKLAVILEESFNLELSNAFIDTKQELDNIVYIWDSYYKVRNELYAFIGLPQKINQSRDRVIGAEIDAEKVQSSVLIRSRLYMRELFCKEVNEKLGLNMSVKLNPIYSLVEEPQNNSQNYMTDTNNDNRAAKMNLAGSL